MFLIFLLIVVAGFLFYLEYDKKITAKIDKISPKIKALKELNGQTKFNKVVETINISEHYDNKWQYNKIEPEYLMLAELRDKTEYYAEYIQMIQENRQNKAIYDERVNEILNMECDIDYRIIGISEAKIQEREAKLFNRMLVPQYVDCKMNVYMYYSSPQGRVRINKSDNFDFDQLVESYNIVSRERLDYQTYQEVAAAERGKVSNSLRYDIMNRDHFRCVICGASAQDGAKLHVDHIVPIAKGGKSIPSNLRTLCDKCNIGKGDKTETGFSN